MSSGHIKLLTLYDLFSLTLYYPMYELTYFYLVFFSDIKWLNKNIL